MMERLMSRAQALAGAAQSRQVAKLAAAMQSMLGSKVQLEGRNVILSGHGLMKRWLTDPALRFLSSGFK
jgi:hypothetical protein